MLWSQQAGFGIDGAGCARHAGKGGSVSARWGVATPRGASLLAWGSAANVPLPSRVWKTVGTNALEGALFGQALVGTPGVIFKERGDGPLAFSPVATLQHRCNPVAVSPEPLSVIV